MSITHITSLAQLNGILSKDSSKLSVIDFHATWCGPCHAIAPTFEALSKEYPSVNFLKCDVDAARDVAGQYKVSAMPTFIFLKGSTKVDEVKGANKAGLQATVRRHASGSSSTSAFSGKGQTLGGSPAPSAPEMPGVGWFSKLDPQAKVLLGLLGAYFVFWMLS
ncbi:thioredoxin family protein [Phanerochaete sordida]|uniref:Thioredoxin n=1 Tax=Phanerochaete sordida TaxID=48140 RepID=A0A9P3LAN7_9APHY|nr:thioredoxin family protein [Phanerochaete sordida]